MDVTHHLCTQFYLRGPIEKVHTYISTIALRCENINFFLLYVIAGSLHFKLQGRIQNFEKVGALKLRADRTLAPVPQK